MASRKDTSRGKVVKTDAQGRKLQVLDTEGGWSAGFSYSLSWDEAMKNAFSGVIGAGCPNFTFTLWDSQYVLPEPGTASVLEVGFDYTPSNT